MPEYRAMKNPIPRRQLSLISFYGEKKLKVSLWNKIAQLQIEILDFLPGNFIPYPLEKIHGTIVGLEGFLANDIIYSLHYYHHRKELQILQLKELLNYFKDSFSPFDIKVGGYKPEYRTFLSQNKSPYERSFNVIQDKVVLMGWPFNNEYYQNSLDELRKKCGRYGALHKYHYSLNDVDNDFYLVIGNIEHPLTPQLKTQLETTVRDKMKKWSDTFLSITLDQLGIVAYADIRLSDAYFFNINEALHKISSLEQYYHNNGI